MTQKKNSTLHHYIPLAAALVVGLIVIQHASLSAELIAAVASGMNADCQQGSSSSIDFQTVDNKYALAFEESLGFFDNIHQDEWEIMRNITLARVNNENTHHPLNDAYKPNKWYQKNWDPDFSCRHEKKIGVGDGAKWICDPHRLIPQADRRMEQYGKEGRLTNQTRTLGKQIRKGCLVYSVGSNGDFRFEEGLQETLPEACEVHTFDFTDYSRKVPPGKNVYFHHWGLKPSYNETKRASSLGFKQMDIKDKPFKTFEETIKELGHEGRPIDIFKIDCEGCEWSTYKDWISADLRQILVEVHRAPEVAQDFFSDLQKAGYVSFHKEPNIEWGADCVEYAMLKLGTKFVEDRLAAAVGKKERPDITEGKL